MKYFLWLLKAAIFFTLFAFALNNQQDATVNFFFGTFWRAPLVLVVLAAFAGGMVVGVLGMLPLWWRHRLAAQQALQQQGLPETPPLPSSATLPAVNAGSGAPEPTIARHHGL